MTTDGPQVTVLSVTSTREELIDALNLLNREAHRAQTIIGSAKYPSDWDNLHEFLDSLLDLLVGK